MKKNASFFQNSGQKRGQNPGQNFPQSPFRASALWLVGAVFCAAAGIAISLAWGQAVPAPDSAVKRAAAAKMQLCMDRVKAYKAEEGLSLAPEDLFDTGLLGDRLTGLTTTLGIVEAKRTTANSDMAALAVQLLREAGVRPGDTIGAGFSGSFPALNLAVLAACDAMEVQCIYIASIGASSYGANQPSLTFPEMACRLADEGLIASYPAAVSAGGQNDLGQDMDPDDLASVWEQLSAWPLTVLREEDYTQNLAQRERLYAAKGGIRCFVAVGGGIATAGKNNAQLGQGLLRPDRVGILTEKSGLLERYCAAGVPCIEFLNIKKLMADYNLPYDPAQLHPAGQSAVYQTISRPKAPALAGLLAALLCLWGCRRAVIRERKDAL